MIDVNIYDFVVVLLVEYSFSFGTDDLSQDTQAESWLLACNTCAEVQNDALILKSSVDIQKEMVILTYGSRCKSVSYIFDLSTGHSSCAHIQRQ